MRRAMIMLCAVVACTDAESQEACRSAGGMPHESGRCIELDQQVPDSVVREAHRRGWAAANRVWTDTYDATNNTREARLAFAILTLDLYDRFMMLSEDLPDGD